MHFVGECRDVVLVFGLLWLLLLGLFCSFVIVLFFLIRLEKGVEERFLLSVLAPVHRRHGCHLVPLGGLVHVRIIHFSLLLFDEHLDVVLVEIQLEVLANVVDEHAHDVPVAQVLDVLFQDVSFEALEGKTDLLVEDLALEVLV